MKLTRFRDANQFEKQVEAYLRQYPAEHNLLLEIIHAAVKNPQRYESQPYLATVEKDGKVVAVAFKVEPFPLVLSKIEAEIAINLITQDLQLLNEKLIGVSGLVQETFLFANAWQSRTHQHYQLNKHLKIHQLIEVQPIPIAKGYLRLVIENDSSLLLQWLTDFEIEAWGIVKQNIEKLLQHYLTNQNLYLWQNEQKLVSMAIGSIVAENFGRIGPVYTPPQYRQKGYASSCVAALSQNLLDQGCERCFLFTDVANPTSNRIYHNIGYQSVCDWHIYQFFEDY